ncbi:MAG: DUF4249 family protein [Reichenbachiella sp.]|uniref:DUF4249 family protein n=1 Tax=Reichenbachiella sp. TaxID=2184521 RepID=UPI0032998AEC
MKNSMHIRLTAIFTLFWFISCEEVPDFEADDTVPVVEAFLYVDNPIDDIKISKVIPFESEATDNEVDGLNIEIKWNGKIYPLVNAENGGGKYFYPGTDLEIISGDNYEISFQFEGNIISSSTTAPPVPTGLSISTSSLELPQLIDLIDIRDLAQSENSNVNIEWNNPNGDYYFLVIENLEGNPEPIDLNNTLNFNFEFVSSPTQDNFFTLIPFVHYTQFGTHRIIVYRVNEEYALLYETIEQDSRDLNEPFTNVKNGVGIFSGFASDTVYLEINKQ